MMGMAEAQRQMIMEILKEAEEKGEKVYVIDPEMEYKLLFGNTSSGLNRY